MIVIDASVAVKWYVAEPLSAEAIALLADHQPDIRVPDIFPVEVGGALVRRANMDKARRDESLFALFQFRRLLEAGMVVPERISPNDLERAARISLDLAHPLKDCLYLVLAMTLGCPLITADAAFAARAGKVSDTVRTIGVP